MISGSFCLRADASLRSVAFSVVYRPFLCRYNFIPSFFFLFFIFPHTASPELQIGSEALKRKLFYGRWLMTFISRVVEANTREEKTKSGKEKIARYDHHVHQTKNVVISFCSFFWDMNLRRMPNYFYGCYSLGFFKVDERKIKNLKQKPVWNWKVFFFFFSPSFLLFRRREQTFKIAPRRTFVGGVH